jgi:hypothetical protein
MAHLKPAVCYEQRKRLGYARFGVEIVFCVLQENPL